jgi:hypothetical protein
MVEIKVPLWKYETVANPDPTSSLKKKVMAGTLIITFDTSYRSIPVKLHMSGKEIEKLGNMDYHDAKALFFVVKAFEG